MDFGRKYIPIYALAPVLLLSLVRLSCAQDTPALRPFTAYIGGGIAHVAGNDGKLMHGVYGFQAGAGVRVIRWWYKNHYPNGETDGPARAGLYLNGNFQFDQSRVNSNALTQAVNANPQNTTILSAVTGHGKYYTATFDPTLRFAPNDRVGVYILAGFGLLRRTIDLTGPATEGNLIQPATESLFGSAGNSGVLTVGAGVDFRIWKGLKIYGESRVLHGYGVNSGATLWPVSAGVRW
jgi:hypothetical protein